MSDITTLGRPLDPAYPTNRAVLVLMPLAGLVAGGLALASGSGAGAALVQGGAGALAALVSWALAREVAPDDEYFGAFLAMAAGFGAYLAFDAALLPAVVALMVARLVARTTGAPATVLDATVVALIGLFAAWRFESPLLAWVVALALVLDAVLRPGLPRQWVFAGLAAGGGAVMWLTGAAGDLTPEQPDLVPRVAVSIAGVATLAMAVATKRVRSVGDAGGESLSVVRVRAAQVLALLAAVAAAAGTGSVEAGAVVWACLLAVAASAAVSSVHAARPGGSTGTPR